MARSKLASTFANVTASQTDTSLVTAVTNRKVRVYGLAVECAGTATTITFNSKGSGSGTAITMDFANGANGGFVLPYSEAGWFETNSGEGLTVNTGSGSTTGIQVLYALEPVPGAAS